MNFSQDELLGYAASFIWPLFRMGSLFISIPVFGISGVPARVRVLAGVAITLVIFPVLPPAPVIPLFSFQGWMVAVQQVGIGICTGFILQMVFSIMMVAGQYIAYSMGLGFASMVDPTTGVQVPVIAQIFAVSASLVFLSVDGHLLALEMLAQSFHTLPIALYGLGKNDLWRIILWSSRIFADGVLLALPIMATLLFVNISFGVASKAAPQLQIFGVGFPITIILGMILIWMGLPDLLQGFAVILHEGFALAGQLLRVS